MPRYYRLLAFGLYIYDDDGASSLKSRDYKDATDLVLVPSVNEDGQ